MTSRTYDALDRLTLVTYADSSTTTYTWDAGNRLIQLTDSLSGTITRTYDLLDRLTQETSPQGTVSYTYDAAGRRTSLTVAGQPTISYGYDNANRLTTITQGTNVVTIAYDTAGRRTSLTLPNGVLTEYTYDAASRLTGLTYKNGPATLGTVTYGYDSNGKRQQIGGTWARTGLPQLLTSATYDAANRPLTFGGAAPTHDFNGNLTSDGTMIYSWDARNRLSGLSGPAVTGSFQYDAVGRRLGKTVNGTTTTVLHDGLDAAQETTGTTLRNILTGAGIDEYLSHASSNGETRFALADVLGSTIALVDGSGAVVTEYTYEPFGATGITGALSENRAQYTGRENDGMGLYYYRARYYDPRLQRFISEDPIGFAGGDINLYAYVRNSPARLVDPLGLYTVEYTYPDPECELDGRKDKCGGPGGGDPPPPMYACADPCVMEGMALAALGAVIIQNSDLITETIRRLLDDVSSWIKGDNSPEEYERNKRNLDEARRRLEDLKRARDDGPTCLDEQDSLHEAARDNGKTSTGGTRVSGQCIGDRHPSSIFRPRGTKGARP